MILAIACLAILVWLYLLCVRGGFWRVRVPDPAPRGRAPGVVAPEIVAIVPARDEAAVIGAAVGSLLDQDYGGVLRVVVVDDHSTDGTAEVAAAAAAARTMPDRVEGVTGAPLPDGWSGKVWAMAQGAERAAALAPTADYFLFADADIAHARGNVGDLVARAERDGLVLASLMVLLHCRSAAERALIPAFVFFFAMLYPFAWVADPRRSTAAAAGGCMLVRRAALEKAGGLQAIKGALIDDCALARILKPQGPIRLDLTREAHSLRGYARFADVWRMVARTAYTELRHQPLRLLGAVLGMGVVYIAPLLLALFADGAASWLGLLAWLMMTVAFWPMVRFYRLAAWRAVTLPLVALFYLGATVDSARRHRQGRGGEWKGRMQAPDRA
jgi:hopene-associated glycosyltransferase HpnB